MKALIVVIALFALTACQSEPPSIVGVWRMDNAEVSVSREFLPNGTGLVVINTVKTLSPTRTLASYGPPSPPRSSRPGEPGALLDTPGTSGPPQPSTALGAAILPQRFNQVSQPG